MVRVYGIPNCDTMKKARAWLADHDVDYDFHDYKKLGVSRELLEAWEAQVGWETLLNRRGMMWRKLDQDTRDRIDRESALRVMESTPSIIKRPVLIIGDQIVVGFSAERYAETLL